jgi:CHAD domain-containing protein
MGEAVRAAVAQGYLRLVAHDLGVRLAEDPEDVHQARVATRRLRSDLRTFRAFLPDGWDAETRRELGWVAEALGRARDADVLLERLQGHIQGLEPDDARAAGGLLARLVDERDQAHQTLLIVMDSDRYGLLLDRLVSAARELPPMKTEVVEPPTHVEPPTDVEQMDGPDDAVIADADVATNGHAADAAVEATVRPDRDEAARRLAPGVVTGPWRHLNRAVQALGPDPADAALHEVRIRAKRLRYACEAVTGVVGKPASRMARAAADLQGILGDFHDAIVAEEWLRSSSEQVTVGEALAAGQLIAHERDDAGRCRSEWEGSWKRLDRRKLRAWLQ